MITGFSKQWRIPALGILMTIFWLGPIEHGNATETGQEIFQSLCATCHTIGKGKLVGPDQFGGRNRTQGRKLAQTANQRAR
jgi:cytochrome c2